MGKLAIVEKGNTHLLRIQLASNCLKSHEEAEHSLEQQRRVAPLESLGP